MKDLEFVIVRDHFAPASGGREGYCLGKIYADSLRLGETLEDEDRRLEAGGEKVYGKTAMPTGRFELVLYASPTHGLVPLFKGVPQFTYTEIHKANRAEELKGCVAVGRVRTATGVANCASVLEHIVEIMQIAEDEGRRCFCTIKREGE